MKEVKKIHFWMTFGHTEVKTITSSKAPAKYASTLRK